LVNPKQILKLNPIDQPFSSRFNVRIIHE